MGQQVHLLVGVEQLWPPDSRVLLPAEHIEVLKVEVAEPGVRPLQLHLQVQPQPPAVVVNLQDLADIQAQPNCLLVRAYGGRIIVRRRSTGIAADVVSAVVVVAVAAGVDLPVVAEQGSEDAAAQLVRSVLAVGAAVTAAIKRHTAPVLTVEVAVRTAAEAQIPALLLI